MKQGTRDQKIVYKSKGFKGKKIIIQSLGNQNSGSTYVYFIKVPESQVTVRRPRVLQGRTVWQRV